MNDGPNNPLGNWRELIEPERREWWQDLWLDTLALAQRYRLPLRSGWWEDSLQVEALAAFCAWVRLYDSGTYNDPDGKLRVLWQLEQLKAVLRPGERAFDPKRDHESYERHLSAICADAHDHEAASAREANEQALRARRRALAAELAELLERLRELDERERLLRAELQHDRRRDSGAAHPERDLAELARTIGELRRRRRELHCQLDETRRD